MFFHQNMILNFWKFFLLFLKLTSNTGTTCRLWSSQTGYCYLWIGCEGLCSKVSRSYKLWVLFNILFIIISLCFFPLKNAGCCGPAATSFFARQFFVCFLMTAKVKKIIFGGGGEGLKAHRSRSWSDNSFKKKNGTSYNPIALSLPFVISKGWLLWGIYNERRKKP